MKIIGTRFTGKNKYGDFEWMCNQELYSDSLFIFNDNEEYHETCKQGLGNAVIRKYNKYNKKLLKPRSAGIPTGTLKFKGYNSLTPRVKKIIDSSINEIRDLLDKYEYDNIYYSVGTNGKLGMSLFVVAEDVIDYIDSQINKLVD